MTGGMMALWSLTVTLLFTVVLLCKIEKKKCSSQTTIYEKCINDLKSKAGENDRFTDDQLAAACKRREDWDSDVSGSKPTPKTSDQSEFLNKLASS